MVYGDAIRPAVLKSRLNAFGGSQGPIHTVAFNLNKSRLQSSSPLVYPATLPRTKECARGDSEDPGLEGVSETELILLRARIPLLSPSCPVRPLP